MDHRHAKLAILLLSEIVISDEESINGRIASYILNHYREISQLSIRELASRMFVSTSSISRFCREIGLTDYSELKVLLASNAYNQEILSLSKDPVQQKKDYFHAVMENLRMTEESVDIAKLYMLARDIRAYEHVALFGPMKASSAAMSLQADLAALGKTTVSKIRLSRQWEYMSTAGKDTLIVIFSMTGVYFDYNVPAGYRQDPDNCPKVYFITSGIGRDLGKLYDEIIYFRSNRDVTSHPFQLEMIAGLITQCYVHLLLDPGNN